MSRIFIISAPSGSGKSTLVRRLLAWDPSLVFSISYTTREPRGQEKNGEDYFFVSRRDFEQMIEKEEFLEWAKVFENYYGTHRRFVDEGEREGRDVVLDIDVQGARQLKEKIPNAVSIFILPPSRGELEKRLRSRGEDKEEVIRRRLAGAALEIREFGEPGRYDYVLVNDDVDQASELLQCIVKAERQSLKSRRVTELVKRIQQTFQQSKAGE
jgi:guanylate kinase